MYYLGWREYVYCNCSRKFTKTEFCYGDQLPNKPTNPLTVEKCSLVISATVWGLGPEGTSARLFNGFL